MSWIVGSMLFIASFCVHAFGETSIDANTLLIAAAIFTLAGSMSWVGTKIGKLSIHVSNKIEKKE